MSIKTKHNSSLGQPVGAAGSFRQPASSTPGSARRESGFFLRLWRQFPIARWIFVGFFLLLAIFRLSLPFIVERYVNGQLNHSQDYGGRVGNIHVQLWRGRYRIDDLKIFKRSGAVRVPLYSAARMFLSIQWDELCHGSLVGEVRMEEPRLNFVSGPTAEQSQTGQEESWSPMLESLFPLKINRLVITNGQVHFQNEFSKPPVDIHLDGMSATATI
jgi:hypothetical protein